MSNKNRSIFSDRRLGADRRGQKLPMPADLDRRGGCRRNRHFQAQPWWLRIDYAVELISKEKNLETELPTVKLPGEGFPNT